MAESQDEVLRALGDLLAVYDEADFETGDVDAGSDESTLLGTHVPGEEEVTFVSEAVGGAFCLENLVIAGDSSFVLVDVVAEA